MFSSLALNNCGKIESSQSVQWPWLVPLFEYNENKENIFVCGSTLITPWHLLTAAHCVSMEKKFFALLGRFNISNDLEENWLLRNISKFVVHEDYEKNRSSYKSQDDLAVITMSEPVTYTNFIQPICLPLSETFVDDQIITATVVGYGNSKEYSAKQHTPKHDILTTMKNSHCAFEREEYLSLIAKESFCGKNDSLSTCASNSGSGMYMKDQNSKFILIGVASHPVNGTECNPKDAVVFVDVSKYRKWIEKGENSFKYFNIILLTFLN